MRDERREHLTTLLNEFETRPIFRARVVEPYGTDFIYLRVVNQDAGVLAEDIGCRIEEDGRHWFTWSWGDIIGPVGDPEGAADKIQRVITPERP
ncbi:hypothetical protein [Thermomonospora umbrina]|uniref:hypothetical protein n=1 Tax=Thermomonospora umbrina TaxID=111806 RepID=UPI000E22BDCB|nr:hypothetical protein [Thermomonospora umbrina]